MNVFVFLPRGLGDFCDALFQLLPAYSFCLGLILLLFHKMLQLVALYVRCYSACRRIGGVGVVLVFVCVVWCISLWILENTRQQMHTNTILFLKHRESLSRSLVVGDTTLHSHRTYSTRSSSASMMHKCSNNKCTHTHTRPYTSKTQQNTFNPASTQYSQTQNTLPKAAQTRAKRLCFVVQDFLLLVFLTDAVLLLAKFFQMWIS